MGSASHVYVDNYVIGKGLAKRNGSDSTEQATEFSDVSMSVFRRARAVLGKGIIG